MLRIVLLSLFLGSCFNIAAFAEEKSTKDWNPASAGPITTWTAPLCGKGKFAIQPFFFYNRARGSFNSEGHYTGLPKGDKKYQYQEQLFMQYGITDRLEIDGQMVYQENYIKQGDAEAGANGLGDSYLFLRYCLNEERDWLPHMTGIFQLKAPTGKYEHADSNKLGTDLMGAGSGGGSWDPGFGLNLTKKLKPFIIHFDSMYSFPQEAHIDGVKTCYANYLNCDLGAEYFLPKGFNLMLEVNGFLQGDKRQDGDTVLSSDVRYLTVVPGVGWSNDKIQTLIAYQRVMIGKNTDANDSVVLTCVYTF